MHRAKNQACWLVLCFAWACSSDDPPAVGTGGGAGQASTGGTGNAGTGGTGGGSGTGGSSAGGEDSGTGGEAGRGGSSATGGSSGGSGRGGQSGSGGGSGGSGGKPAAGSSGKGGSAGKSGGSGEFLAPTPLVCRDKPVESSPAYGEVAFDGVWGFSSTWRAESQADGSIQNTWLKINVGSGPTRLLFVWHTDSTPDYTITPDINFGAPTGYTIEVSATGEDDDWTEVAEVTGEPDDVSYRSRGHSFDFTGMSYVRMTLNRLISEQGQANASIGEIEIHDISAGADDTWAVVGGGASRSIYHGHAGMFPELIHEAHPAYYPALIDLAEAGGTAMYLLTRIDEYLALNPDFHFWILAYGLSDAENNRSPEEQDFKALMQSVIDKIKADGRVPLIPRIEKTTDSNHQTIADYNAVIDELVSENDLPPAPDIYALTEGRPELLCTTGECEQGHEGIDLSPEGEAAVNEAWASTLDPLYAP